MLEEEPHMVRHQYISFFSINRIMSYTDHFHNIMQKWP
jgi:hypothetical protein